MKNMVGTRESLMNVLKGSFYGRLRSSAIFKIRNGILPRSCLLLMPSRSHSYVTSLCAP